jgi:hypothetical protein
MEKNLLDSLHKLIPFKYRSLDAPNRSFVADALAVRPYDSVIRNLKEFIAIEEDTDLNYQVAFEYVLRRETQVWRLELSMLGPLAVLLRADEQNVSVALTDDTPGISVTEQQILKTLVEAQITVLDQWTLSQPIPLRLYIAEPGEVCIYQALFTDTSVLPWATSIGRD